MDKQIRELSKRNKRLRLLKSGISVLCVIVMFFTVTGLKQSADTLTRTPTCGLKPHHHEAKCYDSDGNLVCGKVEHEHTDACYQQRPRAEDMENVLEVEDTGDGLQEPGDLDFDIVLNGIDLDDSLVQDVPTPGDDAAAAANRLENPEYRLGAGAKLSSIIEETKLNIELEKVTDVGVVDNDGTQAGLLFIEKTEKDYVINAAQSFSRVDLGIILDGEVVVVRLTDGQPKASSEEQTEVGSDAPETLTAPENSQSEMDEETSSDDDAQPVVEGDQDGPGDDPYQNIELDISGILTDLDEPAIPTVDEPAIPTVDEPAEPALDEPVEPEADEPIPAEEPAPADGQAAAADEQSDEPAVDADEAPTIDEPAEPAVEEPAELAVEEPAEPVSDEPVIVEEQTVPSDDDQSDESAADEDSDVTVSSDAQDEEAPGEQSDAQDEDSAPANEQSDEPEVDGQGEDEIDEQPAEEQSVDEQGEDSAPVDGQIDEPETDEQGEDATDEQSTDEQPADEQGEDSANEEGQSNEPEADEQSDEPEADGQGDEPEADDQNNAQAADEQPSDEQSEDATDEQSADEQPADEQGEDFDPADEQSSEPEADGQGDESEIDEQSEDEIDEQSDDTTEEQPSDEESEDAADEQSGDESANAITATVDLTDVDSYPLSLRSVMESAAAEAGVEAAPLPMDEWTVDYDRELMALEAAEDDYLVTPLASFETTQIVVENGSRYELTLVNCALPGAEEPEEQPEQPAEEAQRVVTYPAQSFSGSARNINVAVEAPEGAFPEGTIMTVRAVYDSNTLTDIRQTVGDDFTEVKSVRAVDITFTYNGTEIEPLLPIHVVMSGPEIRDEQSAVVVHVDDAGAANVVDSSATGEVAVEMPATSDPEGMQSAIEEQTPVDEAPAASEQGGEDQTSVEFSADSFSIYAYVVTETIETHYIDAAGVSWKITVGYGQEAMIPTGARLRVSELTGEAAEDYLEQTEEALSDRKITLARFFDITILDNQGREVQPKKAVEVRVELDGKSDDEVKAVHFDGEGLEVLPAHKDSEGVTFDAASFSVYGIVYTVDFEYTDPETGKSFAWSLSGQGRYAIADIMSMIGISGALEDITLVCIEGEEEEGALYLVNDGQWWLRSDIAFDEVYVLTLVVDGKEYTIKITDQQVDNRVTAEVYFLNANGTRTSAAETESGNTLNARINLSNSNSNSTEEAYVKVSLAGLDEYVKLNEKFKPNEWDHITFRDMGTNTQYTIDVFHNTTDNSITYRIPPGATGIAALSFTAPNGITANDKTLTLTPTLVGSDFNPIPQESNDVIGGPASGKWTSTFGWDPVQKYVNNAKYNTVVVTSDNGTPVIDTWLRYDYTATSRNRAETGVRWTEEAIIEDTLTLPEHMSFGGSYTCDAASGRIYINGAPAGDNILFGLTLKPNMQCTALNISDNVISYKIRVTNPNRNRTDGLANELSSEMDNISYITELNAAGITLDPDYITEGYYGEEIVNDVDITETPNKGSDSVTSHDQVKTRTKQDEGFKIDKQSAQDGKYVVPGGTIDYTIRVTNTGTVTIAAADSVITDTLPSAVYLTPEEIARLTEVYGGSISIVDNNITFRTGDLAPGAESTVVIYATVKDSRALEQAGYTNESAITNTALYRGLSDYVASKLQTGKVTSKKTSTWSGAPLKDGESVDYTLTAKNATEYDYTGEITLTDDLPKYMTVTLYDANGADITADIYARSDTYENGCFVRDSENNLVPATVVINGDGSARITVKTHDLPANSIYSIVLTATYNESKATGRVDDDGNILFTNRLNVNDSYSETDIKVEVGDIDVDKYVSGAKDKDGSNATQPFDDRTVVTYTIHVINDQNNPYKHDIVVTDIMPRGLVPVGLKVDGVGYDSWQAFVDAFGWNEKAAKIQDGNGNLQDVRVKQEYNGLKLTWTIPNSEASLVTDQNITYKAVVHTDELVNQVTGLQELENTVTVVGREDKEIIVVDVKGVEITKKIVGPNGDLLDTIQIGPGSEVTYQLTIENPNHLNTTVTGITDYLPQGGPQSKFPLSYWKLDDTVLIEKDTNGINQFWTNATPSTEGGFEGKKCWFDNNHYLRFGDIQVTSEMDRLVQRIKLKYPDDATVLHAMFVDTAWWGRQQENKYSISGFKPVEVDHTEVLNKKFYAQKSVIGLAKKGDWNTSSRKSKDLFEEGDVDRVFYTVLVANTGTGPLHIDSLTDVLPAELEFVGIAASDHSAGTHIDQYDAQSITTIDHYTNANYVVPDKYSGLGGVKVEALRPSGNKVLFRLNNDAGVDLPEKAILAFDVQCKLKEGVTLTNGQAITNTLQVNLDSDAALSKVAIPTQRTPDDAIQNNGGCEVVSNDGTTQVAESSVSIHPSNIAVPGILKQAIAYKSQDDTEWKNLNDKTTNINSQSNVKWKITLYNDGAVPLDGGYTLTDAIYEHHKLQSIESFSINGNSKDVNDTPFTSYTTSNEGNYNRYTFTFPEGDTYAIPAGGKAELVLVTTFTTGQYQGQLDNKAVFRPVQSFDANRVIRGQLVKNEEETEYIGVSSMDYVNMLGDGATMSYKVVAEKNDPTNKAYGYDIATGTNYITIDDATSLVTYTNHVQNLSNSTFKAFVMIDRMPEIGDRGVVNAHERRGSEYSVGFAQPLNLTLTFRNSEGTKTIDLEPADYSIEYSSATSYSEEDWAGTSAWSSSPAGAKSFRLKLNPDTLTAKVNEIEGSALSPAVFPSMWVLEVSYDGKPSGDATPGQYAWNSFGYHLTTASGTPLNAEPPKAGVRIKPLPVLKKQVVDSQGVDQGVDTGVKFLFKFYEGQHTLEDLGSLEPIWTYTLCQGQAVQLQTKKMINGVMRGQFTEGQTYTVVEAPASGYSLVGYEKDGLKQTTKGYCVFTYSNELNTTIVCKNKVDETDITAKKKWKSGSADMTAWPEDVASVTFTLFARIGANGTEAQAGALDLLPAGQSVSQPITAPAGEASWTGLPKRVRVPAQGAAAAHWDDVFYSVKETAVTYADGSGKTNLTMAEAVAEAYGAAWNGIDGTITNTVNTERHATKVWVGTPGTQVKFTLSGTWDNGGTAAPVDLETYGVENLSQTIDAPSDAGQPWGTADWTDLPVYTAAGKRITYSVAETAIAGYRTSDPVWDGATKTWTITNTQLTERTAAKRWEGAVEDDRITSITYTIRRKIDNADDATFNALPANTVTIVKTASETAPADRTEVLYSANGNSWDYTWRNLDAHWRIEGETTTTGLYEYTVRETSFVYDGITYNVSGTAIAPDTQAQGYNAKKVRPFWKTGTPATSGTTTTFTNTLDETFLNVIKKWSLNGGAATDDTDGNPTVQFYLYRSDGKVIDSATRAAVADATQATPFTVTRGTDNKWKLHIDGLEKSGEAGEHGFWIVEVSNSEYTTAPTITMVKDGETVDVGSVSHTAPGRSEITITNFKSTVALPDTGGIGTTLFGVGGTALLLLALALFLRKKAGDEME